MSLADSVLVHPVGCCLVLQSLGYWAGLQKVNCLQGTIRVGSEQSHQEGWLSPWVGE